MVDEIQERYLSVSKFLGEKELRWWAATEARVLGHGGIERVSQTTGLARSTISRGIDELEAHLLGDSDGTADGLAAQSRQRKPGAGRKLAEDRDPTLLSDLDKLIAPTTRGDPESPLRWTTLSLSHLCSALAEKGHRVSEPTVSRLLSEIGFSLQAPRKVDEGSSSPHRDDQFQHINAKVEQFQSQKQPVVSIDCKKKELVGNFWQNGQEWHPMGEAPNVSAYDFPTLALGKAIPYGVYDLARNEGWINVGVDHDTAEFAVGSLCGWWQQMGKSVYTQATDLLITADGGGSNSSRSRLFKYELQKFADETWLTLHVCHFPPGTSKWNKIEHRLFSQVTKNWRGKPLHSYSIVINLIGSTATETGLKVQAHIDESRYTIGRAISDEEFESIRLERDHVFPLWNYIIRPRPKVPRKEAVII